MSHSNKRYVVYITPEQHIFPRRDMFGFWDFHFNENDVLWRRYVYDRVELVNRIGYYFRRHDLVEFTTDRDTVCRKDTYVDIPKAVSSRPGIKEWDCKKVTWFCIKIIRNGVEEDVNLKGIIREAEAFAEKPRCAHGWGRGYRMHVSWKDQHKCKRQWETNLPKHIDTFKQRADEDQP